MKYYFKEGITRTHNNSGYEACFVTDTTLIRNKAGLLCEKGGQAT